MSSGGNHTKQQQQKSNDDPSENSRSMSDGNMTNPTDTPLQLPSVSERSNKRSAAEPLNRDHLNRRFKGSRNPAVFYYAEQDIINSDGEPDGEVHYETKQRDGIDPPEYHLFGRQEDVILDGQKAMKLLRDNFGWYYKHQGENEWIIIAPGYTRDDAEEGVTKYTGYGAMGKAFQDVGRDAILERAKKALRVKLPIWKELEEKGWNAVTTNSGRLVILAPGEGFRPTNAEEGITMFTGYAGLQKVYEENGKTIDGIVKKAQVQIDVWDGLKGRGWKPKRQDTELIAPGLKDGEAKRRVSKFHRKDLPLLVELYQSGGNTYENIERALNESNGTAANSNASSASSSSASTSTTPSQHPIGSANGISSASLSASSSPTNMQLPYSTAESPQTRISTNNVARVSLSPQTTDISVELNNGATSEEADHGTASGIGAGVVPEAVSDNGATLQGTERSANVTAPASGRNAASSSSTNSDHFNQAEHETIEQMMNQCTYVMNKLREKIDTEMSELKNRNQDLQARNDGLQARNHDLETKLSKADEQNVALDTEKKQLETKLSDMKRILHN